jgi:hypothetical protein
MNQLREWALTLALCVVLADVAGARADSASPHDTPNVPLKAVATTGSMQARSNILTLPSAVGFKAGDGIIVATGGEADHGLRGTVGVGGVWPQKNYATLIKMHADHSQPIGTFAWVTTDAVNGNSSVYQWDGASWTYYTDGGYYFNTAIPRALVGYVCTVANGGTVLTLGTHSTKCSSNPFYAAVATSSANVYYDNAPLLNSLWNPPTANNTYTFPSGNYAIGSEVDIGQSSCGTPPCQPGVVIQGQGGYPTCNTTLFSPNGSTSAALFVNVDGTNTSNGIKIKNFCMTGNSRQTGYGLDWNYVSETTLNFPYVVDGGVFLSPSAYATISGMQFRNTWGGCLMTASDGASCLNATMTLDDPLLIEQWAFGCSATDVGCTMQNITLTSNSGLTDGFMCFGSYNCSFTNINSTNGLFDFNNAGNWTAQGITITITPNSATPFIGFSNPVIPIDTNAGSDHVAPGGRLNNVSITIQGYVDASNNDLLGIAVDAGSPNITIDADSSSSSYSAPNCGTGATYGPIALSSNGQTTVVNNMTATGTPCAGDTHFEFTPGAGHQCNNCSGTVSGLP